MKNITIENMNRVVVRSLAILLVSALVIACGSSKTATVDAAFVAKSGFVMAKPLVADIKVESRKIEGKAVIKNSLYGKDLAIRAAKNLAVIDAIKQGDADIIVQPVYLIESTNQFTTATVSGFAGKYREFRAVTASDTLAFRVRKKLNNYYEGVPAEVSVSKKKK